MDAKTPFNATTLVPPHLLRKLKRAIALHGSPLYSPICGAIYKGDGIDVHRFGQTMRLLRMQSNQPKEKKNEIIELEKELKAYETKNEVYLETACDAIINKFSRYSIDWVQTVSSRAVRDEVRKDSKKLPNKLNTKLPTTPYVAHCIRWLYEASDQTGSDADWRWKAEDWPQVTFFLAAWMRAKNVHGVTIDLNKIETFKALKEAVKDYMPDEGLWHTRHALVLLGVDQQTLPETWRFDHYEPKPAKQTTAQAGTLQATILHADNERIIVRQENEAASRAFGMGTNWCTAYQNEETAFDYYSNDLIFICDKKGTRHQASIQHAQIMDYLDSPANIESLLRSHPPLRGILEENLSDNLDIALNVMSETADELMVSDIIFAFRNSKTLTAKIVIDTIYAHGIEERFEIIKKLYDVLMDREDWAPYASANTGILQYSRLADTLVEPKNCIELYSDILRHIFSGYKQKRPIFKQTTHKDIIAGIDAFETSYPIDDLAFIKTTKDVLSEFGIKLPKPLYPHP